MITARPLYPTFTQVLRFLFICYVGFHLFVAYVITGISTFSNFNPAYPKTAVAIVVGFQLLGLGICRLLQTELAKYGVMVCLLYFGMGVAIDVCSAPMPSKFCGANPDVHKQVRF